MINSIHVVLTRLIEFSVYMVGSVIILIGMLNLFLYVTDKLFRKSLFANEVLEVLLAKAAQKYSDFTGFNK